MLDMPDLGKIAKDALQEIVDRVSGRFSRIEPLSRFSSYLTALTASTIERKNTWQISEEMGDRTPDGFQHFLRDSKWEPDEVRDDLHAYVAEYFNDDDGVLVVDETGFPKKGEHSAGVQRQYTGTTGKIDNCQIGVFLTYVAPAGATLVDRELYIPQVWIKDRERCRDAGIPDELGFQTKPQMAAQMIERARNHGIRASWVTGDEVYGNDGKFRAALEGQGLSYVLAVRSTHQIIKSCRVQAAYVARWWPPDRWKRQSAGNGSKGPREYDWAFRILPCKQKGWERALLIRRSISKPSEMAYYLTYAPEGTLMEKLVEVAGKRWPIESCFQDAKKNIGLDHYEVRSWTGWYRHITIAMFALAYLSVVQIRSGGEKKRRRARSSRGASPTYTSRNTTPSVETRMGQASRTACRSPFLPMAPPPSAKSDALALETPLAPFLLSTAA